MTKKTSSEIFGFENGTFLLKKGYSKIWCAKFFGVLPKLGAKSPPMYPGTRVHHIGNKLIVINCNK